jgi:hypothetical protein
MTTPSELTVEQKHQIGDRIAEIMGIQKSPFVTGGYRLSGSCVTAMGVYDAFMQAKKELEEEGKIDAL